MVVLVLTLQIFSVLVCDWDSASSFSDQHSNILVSTQDSFCV